MSDPGDETPESDEERTEEIAREVAEETMAPDLTNGGGNSL
jgi:hypothetical protein